MNISSNSLRRWLQPKEALQRGIPHLVDLRTMRQVNAEDLGDSALIRSIEACQYIGSGVVIYFRDPNKIHIGNGCELRDYCVLEVGGSLEVGAGSIVGAYNWFQASGSVKIGAGVLIGPHTMLISTEHEKPDHTGQLRETALKEGVVTISDNVWVGANVTVLMNVTIGAKSTIGAGSVVTRSIPEGAIAYGVPCKIAETR